MERINFKGKSPTERARLLKDNCDKVEELGYVKPFTEDELTARKENLAELSIAIDELEEEKKAQVADFNLSIKSKKKDRSTLIRDIRDKSHFVRENCYKFIDSETRTVEYYNDEGVLVYNRAALANELQLTVFQTIGKTGTDN